MGNGGYGQIIACWLCHSFLPRGRTSHTLLLLHRGASHGRQFSMNLTNTGPSHGLQFFLNCAILGLFHRVQSFRNRLLLPASLLQCSSLSMGPQVLPGAYSSAGLPSGRSLLQASTCSGVLYGLHTHIFSTVDLHGVQGTACLTVVFTTSCRVISAPAPGATSSPSFCTDLGVCRVVSLTYSHSSLLTPAVQFFSPLLSHPNNKSD